MLENGRNNVGEAERIRERFELAIRGSNDGIWDWDLRSDSLYLSSRWKDQLGYGEDELANEFETFRSLLYEADRQRVMEAVEAYLAGRVDRYELEFRMRHKDGSLRWIMARGEAIRDSEGRPWRMAGSHTDITERKEAEQRFERLFRGNPAPMAISSLPDRRFMDVNESFIATTGYQSQEVIGRSVEELNLFPDAGQQQAVAQTLLETGRIGGIELKVRRKDGSLIDGLFSGEIISSQGKPFFLTVMVDITERKQSQRQLEESNRKLEDAVRTANDLAHKAHMASEAKSEFLANMSHEIRTPLNGIIGMTDLLLDTALSDEQRRFAEILRLSGDSLLSLVNDILDFSKMEANKLELERIDFDLGAVVAQLVLASAVKAREKGLELTCVIDPRVPLNLNGDPGRLAQILRNLLGNAIKFTSQGAVALTVDLDALHGEKAVLHFGVCDSGIGIPADKIQMIFDKFSQVDASMTRRFGGTGLGLAISRQLAELMGGRIQVESPVSKPLCGAGGPGSFFRVTVPFGISREQSGDREHGQGRPQAEARSQGPTVSGSRILLAEDNVANRQVALGILEKLGCRVDAVENGAEVLNALKAASYDLVLMDVQMPVMDGVETTRRIRESASEIPVIAVTAHAMSGDREAFIRAGMNDYLSKPVSVQSVGDMLKKWLTNEAGPKRLLPAPEAMEPLTGETPPDCAWDRLGLLKRMMGDEGLVAALAQGFVSDMPRQINLLRSAVLAGDEAELKRLAHSLKGSAANIGAPALMAAAESLENRVFRLNHEQQLLALDSLISLFDDLKQAIAGELNGI